MRRLACIVFALSLVPRAGAAQEAGGQGVVFGGEAGTFGELYGVAGAEQRRPTATGRIYLRPSMSLYGKFTITMEFLLSTQGHRFGAEARQTLNQYSISPDWGWGNATIGNFTGNYSPLTYSGIRALGVSAEVRRGSFTLSSFGGRSQRATTGGAVAGGYSRTVAGGRVGIGDPDRTSLMLIVLGARDDVDSRPPPSDTLFLEPQPDTAFAEDTVSIGFDNQFTVTPQQNLVVSVAGSLTLLDDRVALKGELAGSGYTRDLRSEVITNPDLLDRIPDLAEALFTPRVSSSADYAYTLEARLRPVQPLTTTVTFRNLGPGYVSLGTASLMSDARELQVRTALRFRRTQTSIDIGRQSDNLGGQKSFTTQRDRLGAAFSMRVTDRWTSSLRLQRATLDNHADEPERWIAYGSWLVGGRQTVTFPRESLFRSSSLDYTFRTTGDDNPLRVASTSRSHTLNTSVVLSPTRALSFTPTVGLVRSQFGEDGWSTRSTFGLGAQFSADRGRWVSGLNLGRSQVHQTTAVQTTLTSRYQLTRRDAIVFSVRANDYHHVVDADRSFREATASLRWAHRF